jgi:hypothetical protein
MRKDNFFNRYPQSNKSEAERKWKLYQEEQEQLRLMEQQFQFIQEENFQFFSGGHISVGGARETSVSITYSDLAETPVQFDSLDSWNSHFDLPNYGPAFTDIRIEGNTIILVGQPGITVRHGLFSPGDKGGDQYLTSIVDTGCITGPIMDRAFSTSHNLVEVRLPYTPYIQEWNFLDCNNLSTLDLSSVVTIDQGVFYNTSSLVSVTLPQCTSLGSYAFYGSNVTSLSLLLVETLGEYVMEYCTYLLDLDLPRCTSIGSYSFYAAGLTHLSIPSCTNLGGNADNNWVFGGIADRIMTLTLNPYLLTNNNGDVDGDIAYLQDPTYNNTITIN